MRSRADFEHCSDGLGGVDAIQAAVSGAILEVLLDIRDLLSGSRRT
jgi:hypothetical protein